MFGRGNDGLPMHGGSKRNNGIKGMPMVDKGVALSLLFGFFSILLIGFGIYHSKNNRYSYSITCRQNECEWKIQNKGEIRTIAFPKSDFLEAEAVRIDKSGEYIDTSRMKISESNKFGHSIRLRLRVPPEPDARLKVEKLMMFMPMDMGRRTVRSGVKSMQAFILDQEKDRFIYTQGKSVTIVGILSCFFGFLALLLVVLFGKWRESVPQKLKKAS
mmetsp:Transcript_9547/g.10266  ORF Transcript_9547/g.10266 Transcript_9547/m.10266 type:complete len:216 (-) Transcript_9547:133-780(-)